MNPEERVLHKLGYEMQCRYASPTFLMVFLYVGASEEFYLSSKLASEYPSILIIKLLPSFPESHF